MNKQQAPLPTSTQSSQLQKLQKNQIGNMKKLKQNQVMIDDQKYGSNQMDKMNEKLMNEKGGQV